MLLQRGYRYCETADMMKSILDRSPPGLVVDYELLMQAAEDGTAPLMTLLLAHAPLEEIKAESLLAAAVRSNYRNTIAVVEALLAALGPEVVAAPNALIWANSEVMDLLIDRHGAQILPIPRLIMSMVFIDAFEVLFTFRPEVTTQATMAGFRMYSYAYQDSSVRYRMINVAKYLLGANIPLTDDTLLDMLEYITRRWGGTEFLEFLLVKRDDDIVLTERVLAAMIEPGRDAIALVKQWRRDEFIITPAIISMTAASGKSGALHDLHDACRASGSGIFDDEFEYNLWKWIAQCRGGIRYGTAYSEPGIKVALSSVQNTYGLVPLHMAAAACPEMLRQVLAHCADGGGRRLDRRGWTALHHAVVAGHPENVKMLLDAGAERRLKGAAGETPADLARWTAEFAMSPERHDWRDAAPARRETLQQILAALGEIEGSD